ncbi:MAG: hypothetical protein V4475_15030 [Pseudomonadota bacterium]
MNWRGALLLPILLVSGASAEAQQAPNVSGPKLYFKYVIGETDEDTVSHPATFQFQDVAGVRSVRPTQGLRALFAGCTEVGYQESYRAPYEYEWYGNCPGFAPDQRMLIELTGTSTAVSTINVRMGRGQMIMPPVPVFRRDANHG